VGNKGCRVKELRRRRAGSAFAEIVRDKPALSFASSKKVAPFLGVVSIEALEKWS
jgi:hypothetical protein